MGLNFAQKFRDAKIYWVPLTTAAIAPNCKDILKIFLK